MKERTCCERRQRRWSRAGTKAASGSRDLLEARARTLLSVSAGNPMVRVSKSVMYVG